PSGTYVAEECKEQNTSGRCVPCDDGEFMEYSNAFRQCRDCGKCREDQVEVKPCQLIRNTVCACRNGTFCPPDHPCEMCQKCRPRCPEGQVVLKPCTPYSDLQCGPATDTGPEHIWAIVLVLVVFGVALCVWCCCRSPAPGRTGEGDESHLQFLGRLEEQGMGLIQQLLGGLEGQGMRLTQEFLRRLEEQGMILIFMTLSFQVMLQNEIEKPKRNLVPAPGNDPIQVLRRSFYTFARKIPKDDWKKFGRSLDLEENDIVLEWTDDAFYQMLYKWLSREGSKSSVNTLLETLVRLHLGGVAEDISSTLVKNGIFQYETS
ncbi:TR10A factor, partial [Myiagra hebetior]|nr:TR10A factor [Myiagra hebetior]